MFYFSCPSLAPILEKVPQFEDLGNWFYSCEQKGDSALMRTMADDLDGRLKNVAYD